MALEYNVDPLAQTEQVHRPVTPQQQRVMEAYGYVNVSTHLLSLQQASEIIALLRNDRPRTARMRYEHCCRDFMRKIRGEVDNWDSQR